MIGVTRQRLSLWLGREYSDDTESVDIQREDDMVLITANAADGSEIEIFIFPELFDEIRAVMDRLDNRR